MQQSGSLASQLPLCTPQARALLAASARTHDHKVTACVEIECKHMPSMAALGRK